MLGQQIVSIFFVDLRLALLVVTVNFCDTHRNVVQILLEQRLQFALQIPFVQVVHFLVARYYEAGAKLNKNADNITDGFFEANHVILDIDYGKH